MNAPRHPQLVPAIPPIQAATRPPMQGAVDIMAMAIGSLLPRKIIGRERVAGPGRNGSSDAISYAGEKQMHDGVRKSPERRHDAPECHADGDDRDSASPVRQTRYGHGQNRTEKDDGDACDQPHHRIRLPEFTPDAFEDDVDDVDVRKLKRPDQSQKGKDIIRFCHRDRVAGLLPLLNCCIVFHTLPPEQLSALSYQLSAYKYLQSSQN